MSKVLALLFVFAFAGAFVDTDRADAAAFFSANQQFAVFTDHYFGWWVGVWDYNSNQWDVSVNGGFSDNFIEYVDWTLPFGAWYGAFCYDYGANRYTEVVYIYDEQL